MQTVSLFEAKTNLSKIVESLIDGSEQEIVISRRGKPVVRLTPLNDRTDTTKRIGIAKTASSSQTTSTSPTSRFASCSLHEHPARYAHRLVGHQR
jgi:prevent-host-death family protein